MAERTLAYVFACGCLLVATTHAQIIEVPRDNSAERPKILAQQPKPATHPVQAIAAPSTKVPAVAAQPTKPATIAAQPTKAPAIVSQQPKAPATKLLTIEDMRKAGIIAAQRMKDEIHQTEPPPVATTRVAPTPKQSFTSAVQPLDRQSREIEMPVSLSSQTAFIKLADGFDFPVGKPDAQGYYKARGFRSNGHLGEDWDGVGGGDTDLGDPIYCIGDGVVVFARDCHQGWGNVIIVRHAYREGGVTHNIDSLYGHLLAILVHRGQTVHRGQQIATLGTAHGLYDAHLHLEIRKNIEIGMSRAKFAQDFSNYYDPSQFILQHRHLQSGGASYRVALNTFTQDTRIQWDKLRNYSHAHTGGGSSESAAALKKAVASQNSH
jgi:murein DD-endopeptidase MepM/ murein hydrolase activator NlpD